ncbi:hypothetical protein CRUP_022429 [Coryphaenoides rupestris]|nr:hypothetical protein CRUP_022429 [Coryphaenoides rupestris]
MRAGWLSIHKPVCCCAPRARPGPRVGRVRPGFHPAGGAVCRRAMALGARAQRGSPGAGAGDEAGAGAEEPRRGNGWLTWARLPLAVPGVGCVATGPGEGAPGVERKRPRGSFERTRAQKAEVEREEEGGTRRARDAPRLGGGGGRLETERKDVNVRAESAALLERTMSGGGGGSFHYGAGVEGGAGPPAGGSAGTRAGATRWCSSPCVASATTETSPKGAPRRCPGTASPGLQGPDAGTGRHRGGN